MSNPEIGINGSKFWKNESGELHRVGGPAVEYVDGTKEWYINNCLHRVDGPAVETFDGVRYWYFHGKFHRVDGPAIEYPDGTKQWWVDDRPLSEEEFLKHPKCKHVPIKQETYVSPFSGRIV